MKLARSLALILTLTLSGTSMTWAVQPDEVLPDRGLEARARALSQELRCLVCQNQSIDDSDAPLARDLRILLRERLKDGDSDRQAIDFLVARYGEFVLLRPPLAWHTALLWFWPAGLLLAGSLVLALLARRRSSVPNAIGEPLTAEEAARVAEALEDKRF
jgi:cytochrome c-type biogenesis protein CcmH